MLQFAHVWSDWPRKSATLALFYRRQQPLEQPDYSHVQKFRLQFVVHWKALAQQQPTAYQTTCFVILLLENIACFLNEFKNTRF